MKVKISYIPPLSLSLQGAQLLTAAKGLSNLKVTHRLSIKGVAAFMFHCKFLLQFNNNSAH